MGIPPESSPRSPEALLAAIEGLRVVVLGDFFLDEYVDGSLLGLSPEMPVPRLVRERTLHRPGAAGNLAAAFAALGAQVRALGVRGDDAAGDRLHALLAAAGVDVAGLALEAGRTTPTITRFTSPGPGGAYHHLRVDHVSRAPIQAATLATLHGAIDEGLREAAVVFVADYDESGGPGVVTPAVLAAVRRAAAKSGARSFGTSRRRVHMLSGLDVLVANEREVEGLGLPRGDDASDDGAVLEALGLGAACVTRGPRGARWIDARGVQRIEPRPSVEVDACGAGDSFAATLALGLAAGAEPALAGRLAATAGGLAVEHAGTVAVTRRDLRDAAATPPGPPGPGHSAVARKLRSLAALERELEGLRAGHRIVFTNGCFDVFHPGHIRFLREARSLGDCLVVALNSDRSTAANKGPGRPVIPEEERIELLAGLDAVDFVLLFDELTPVKAIAALRPDVLVKGGNYRVEEVVGRGLVEQSGGRVVIVPHSGSFDTEAFMAAVARASDGRRE